MAEKNRISYIDIASGILIIYMIMEHIDVWFSGLCCFRGKALLTFYMPFFFYKSGLLSKPNSKIRFMKFLKPFLLTGIACYIITLLCIVIEAGSLSVSDLVVNPIKTSLYTGSFLIDNPTWFLLTLLIVKILGGGIIKFKTLWQYVSIMLFTILAYVFYKLALDYRIPQLFGNTCTGLVFFVLGYATRDIWMKRSSLIVSIAGYILFIIIGFPSVIMHWNTLEKSIYVLWFPASLFGIALCLWVCKYISRFRICNIFCWYGNHAMYALCIHWPVLLIFSRLLLQDVLGISNRLVLFVACTIFIFLFMPISNMLYKKWEMCHSTLTSNQKR